MNDEKPKVMKRIKLLRIGFIVSIITVIIGVCQVIFESPDVFGKVLHWFILIIWIPLPIINWFEYKKAKAQLENQA